MNILIVGNGFDLAHERPTRYTDFLRFLQYILHAKNYRDDQEKLAKSLTDVCPTVKEYVLDSYNKRKQSVNGTVYSEMPFVQEIYNCLDQNVWYEYFQTLLRNNVKFGKNWIDFESEIREVIQFFDSNMGDLYEEFPEVLNNLNGYNGKIAYFGICLNFSSYNQANDKPDDYRNTYFDLIEKTYQDLEKLIRCLEIYLDDCVKYVPITCCSADIQQLNIDFILNFNYTPIPLELYPRLGHSIHYIHGNANSGRSVSKNNMVLGVNEYWEGRERDVHTHFNLYKKFIQRIMKTTGIDYKKQLTEISRQHKMLSDNTGFEELSYMRNCVYIFGHSLDVTDGDILREIIKTPGVTTIIFYNDKQQQANQIANLSKILTQDTLLEYTFSVRPKIIFLPQTEMEPVKHSDSKFVSV